MKEQKAGSWGNFPFGRPNSVRPPRKAERPAAVVIGVYPSAWHVHWTAPAFAAAPNRRGKVAAMAVDVEPTVFWDGSDLDWAQSVADWKDSVGFQPGDDPGQHGHTSDTCPALNGSSGKMVLCRYLVPLGLRPESVTFTDVYPVFMTKHTSGGNRQQGDAISQEYNAIAAQMQVPLATLPQRIPARRLPEEAAKTFGFRLVAELAEAAAPLVITLGQEVWETMRRLPDVEIKTPVPAFNDLYGEFYGRRGTLTVVGHQAELAAARASGAAPGPSGSSGSRRSDTPNGRWLEHAPRSLGASSRDSGIGGPVTPCLAAAC